MLVVLPLTVTWSVISTLLAQHALPLSSKLLFSLSCSIMPPVGIDSTDVEDVFLVWPGWLFIQYGGEVTGDIGEMSSLRSSTSSSLLLFDNEPSIPWLDCGAFGASDSVSVSVSVAGGDGGGFKRRVVCDRFLCTPPFMLLSPLTWVSTTDAIHPSMRAQRMCCQEPSEQIGKDIGGAANAIGCTRAGTRSTRNAKDQTGLYSKKFSNSPKAGSAKKQSNAIGKCGRIYLGKKKCGCH